MLKSQQILDLLQNVPEGYLKPDDNLFAPSNSNLLQSYKKLGAINSDPYILEESSTSSHPSSNDIFCNVLNCNLVFDNVASYQSHYNSMHRFVCLECKKTLPTEHLLDLHISEQHDSYFQARLDRGEHLYKCYVEECGTAFPNSAERKEHCIEQHKFPGNFRFDQISNKSTGAVPKKFSKKKCEDAMDLEDQKPLEGKKDAPLKSFSFGHQRERTFQLKNCSKNKPEPGRALENLDSLKEALSLV